MILVFGGTTEGKAIAGLLDDLKEPFFYSTKTKLKPIATKYGKVIQGGMDDSELKAFCLTNKIRIILNGSHPFAIQLHKNIGNVAAQLNLPVIRLERLYPDLTNRTGIICVKDYNSALEYIQNKGYKKLLALTGVQTIPLLKEFWDHQDCWFRILDREESYRKAGEYGFLAERLIGETPVDSVQYELDIIDDIQPDAILSKESGQSGFFLNKMKAAQKAKIPFIVVERPVLPSHFQLVNSISELKEKLEQI